MYSYLTNNVWDNCYPSGGNFWGDYDGIDLFSGPYQNETGSDGIGDTSYVIDENNVDHYPLMKPYPWDWHDVGITNLSMPRNIVLQGCSLNISVMLFNYGNFTENVNVSIHLDIPTIFKTTITLQSRSYAILTFEWNTSDVGKGNHTIWAYAEPVEGEIDTDDNVFVAGRVWVKWPYDVTGDNYCGIDDIVAVAEHFGAMPGEPNWNPIYDLTCDDYVGIDDIVEMADHFGQTDP